jgi:hypothetical protein
MSLARLLAQLGRREEISGNAGRAKGLVPIQVLIPATDSRRSIIRQAFRCHIALPVSTPVYPISPALSGGLDAHPLAAEVRAYLSWKQNHSRIVAS